MSDSSHLKRQLSRYKNLLANLSRKNRELYYRESKSSTINLSKQPFPLNSFIENKKNEFTALKFSTNSFDHILKGNDFDLNKHFQLDRISDAEAVNRLNNRLDKVRMADDKHQREFGISGAWLLGPFLCWRTTPQAAIDDLLISPLFKIPVNLIKGKKKNLNLKVEDELLVFNPSLRMMLKSVLGLNIPENKSFENINQAVNFLTEEMKKIDKQVEYSSEFYNSIPKIPAKYKLIKDENGEIIERIPVVLEDELSPEEFEVYKKVSGQNFLIIDVMYLDQMNASRNVLINDYEGIQEDCENHPILSELFNGSSVLENDDTDRSKLRELDAYKEKNNHFVIDIDSTQHRAIDRATKSKAIVIQGPPGSGKSQTIVNLIADYLSKGKKILFVSEKRPALDVVYNRMKSAGIESQAVLIHSSDLNKSELYNSFLELVKSEPCTINKNEWEEISSELDQIKGDINLYAENISSIHQESNLACADLIYLASETSIQDFNKVIAKQFNSFKYSDVIKIASELDNIQILRNSKDNLFQSYWFFRRKDVVKSKLLLSSLSELRNFFESVFEESKKIIKSTEGLLDSNFDKEQLLKINCIKLPNKISKSFSPLWVKGEKTLASQVSIKIEDLAKLLEELAKNNTEYSLFKPNQDVAVISKLEKYFSSKRKLSDFFSSQYWRMRKIANEVCPAWDGGSSQFKSFRDYISLCEEIKKYLSSIANHSLESDNYEIIKSEIGKYIEVLTELKSFLEDSSFLSKKIIGLIENSMEDFNSALKIITDVKSNFILYEKSNSEANFKWPEVTANFKVFPEMESIEGKYEFVSQILNDIDHLDLFERIADSIDKISTTYNVDFNNLINDELSKNHEKWSKVLMSSVLNSWHDQILLKHKNIKNFNGNTFAALKNNFQGFVQKHKESSSRAVHQAFAERWFYSSDRTGVPLLAREAGKQKRILSPREIMEKGALGTMMQLKPCWLMSPLSISQLLPLMSGLFDVIIFDEASQVRVEDAIPSIYRAKTMIVVGDDKQMPPTNFFSGFQSDDEEDDEEGISPSVLDLASLAYPSVLLEWHYRSKAESLIAFSNRAFYGGRLIAAPNPYTIGESNSLKMVEVTDAFFKSKDGNVNEANAVVEKLVGLLKDNPNRSYGIIAMGQSQAVAIEEAILQKELSDPLAKELFDKARNFVDKGADAGLFCKNLENVQGDERDVILMSVGYAPAEIGKKLRMNFGPLSKQGGGRRMNVAITRAKEKMYVFCSFAPALLDTSEEAFSKNPDLCVFGRYLKYVQAVSNNQPEVAYKVLDSFPMGGVVSSRKSSRFALDVKRRLEQAGYKVSSEIGSSGFYIDLGVHHPNNESTYMLGIECDGAIFHSTPYARDRDKIREDLLKSRGWKITRVWSQDWSNDWRREIIRIENVIQLLQESSKTNEDKKNAVST